MREQELVSWLLVALLALLAPHPSSGATTTEAATAAGESKSADGRVFTFEASEVSRQGVVRQECGDEAGQAALTETHRLSSAGLREQTRRQWVRHVSQAYKERQALIITGWTAIVAIALALYFQFLRDAMPLAAATPLCLLTLAIGLLYDEKHRNLVFYSVAPQ